MDYISLDYLPFKLKSKVKYKYSTWFLKQNRIYTYNFESIAEATK